MRLGIHLPNRRLETGELDRIIRVGCSDFVVYVPNLGDAGYWVQVCKDLKTKVPGAQVHLRLEKRGSLGDPKSECLNEAAVANQFYNTIDSWTYRNEPNIECDANVTAAQWQTWLTTFLTQAKASILPPVAAPPVSPGARDAQGFLQATAAAANAAGVTKWHIHFYGNPDQAQSDMDRHRALFAGDLIGTEYNFGAGNTYNLSQYITEIPEVCRRAAARRIKTVGVFIWQWFTPPSIPTTVNIRDTIVEPAMTSMQKSYPEPSGGTVFTVTPAQFDRLVRDTWTRANVVYNPNGAFARYWTDQWKNNNRYLGAPEGQELLFEDTHLYIQKFASVTLWCRDTDFIVHEGHPPFS